MRILFEKIKYLRLIIDEKGRWPDSSRANAIMNIPVQTNISFLQSFWGFANYYSNLIPNMHTLRAFLNKYL